MAIKDLSFFMNKCYKLIVGFSMVFIAGCSTNPANMGISTSEWQSYSPEQQQKILADYQKISAANVDFAAKKSKSQTSTYLEVKVSSGQALMEPFTSWESFYPATFMVDKNDCKNTILRQIGGEKQIELKSCYLGDTLFIDPSRYDPAKQAGTVQINYSPMWQQGFAYAGINSNGYVRLKNTTMEIKQKHRAIKKAAKVDQ